MEDSITEDEIAAVNACLRSGEYTQGALVEQFEQAIARWNGSHYGIMVNSGSSANLLMVDLLRKKYGLQDGDEVLVPAVTWTTTIYPILQHHLKPVFCDVDGSFNIDINSMKRMLSAKTRAVFAVHLLGQAADMPALEQFCQEHHLLLIEDCCESMGASINGKKVGNFGSMGSLSFYFGHHMTTIEGGMILTNDFDTADMLRSTRSHGWVKKSARIDNYPEFLDKNFIFDMTGYNLRSTNLNAAIGLAQFKKLDQWIAQRRQNHQRFLERMRELDVISQKVDLREETSFCLPLIFRTKEQKEYIIKNLARKGIEGRPIVAGNLLRQPVFRTMGLRADKTPVADLIHDNGLYLPNNQFITPAKVDYMIDSVKELLREIPDAFATLKRQGDGMITSPLPAL